MDIRHTARMSVYAVNVRKSKQMNVSSPIPFLLPAFFEWMAKNNLTQRIHVTFFAKNLVARAISTGQIVKLPVVGAPSANHVDSPESRVMLNLSASACRDLELGDETIQMKTAVNGLRTLITVPTSDIDGLMVEYGDNRVVNVDLGLLERLLKSNAPEPKVEVPQPTRPKLTVVKT